MPTYATAAPAVPARVQVTAAVPAAPVQRINSVALMDGKRELEIEHSGKIYRLRVTQLNKLILTA